MSHISIHYYIVLIGSVVNIGVASQKIYILCYVVTLFIVVHTYLQMISLCI